MCKRDDKNFATNGEPAHEGTRDWNSWISTLYWGFRCILKRPKQKHVARRCGLRIESSVKQVPTIKSKNVAPKEWLLPTRVGKAPGHLSFLQVVHVTRMGRDTLRQCAFGLSPLRLLDSRSQTSPLKGQRPRPHIHRRDKPDSMNKRPLVWYGPRTLGTLCRYHGDKIVTMEI